ncbi:MAG: hypothetical protein GY938_16780 [Ketobacter sp.]|nr:hypothetical protein [Ketobacter sp.]
MNSTQPQLIDIALNPNDIVYTPDWVAMDMVEWFKPSGRILEPSAGDGVFLKYLPPHTEWCEIEQGRDFFAWSEPVDWIVGNPPYTGFTNWLDHSFSISTNVLYLIPFYSIWNSLGRIKATHNYGSINHSRVYDWGSKLGWSNNYPIGAIHFQRGYTGGMTMSFYDGDIIGIGGLIVALFE